MSRLRIEVQDAKIRDLLMLLTNQQLCSSALTTIILLKQTSEKSAFGNIYLFYLFAR